MDAGQPSLVIGCPAYRRDWIIADWYEHAARSAAKAGLDPTFVVVGDPVNDRSTFDALSRVMSDPLVVADVAEDPLGTGERGQWTNDRLQRMVELRNRLLHEVRSLAPALFLSLDSDILLHPEALTRMVTGLAKWEAMGSKVYMEPTAPVYPSYALVTRTGAMYQPEAEGMFRVDVIMAIKLMTPPAYHVDYVHHWKGEDLGWSFRARELGVRLGWDGGVCSKHVMRREHLHRLDERCGY